METNQQQQQLTAIENKLNEIDIVNDQNQKNIISLFKLVNEVNKKSRAQLRQEIKSLQGLLIGCFAVAFFFFSGTHDGKPDGNVDKLAESVTTSIVNNMDKFIALLISGVGGYTVLTAKKAAEKEEEKLACTILEENNIPNQEKVLKSGNNSCEQDT